MRNVPFIRQASIKLVMSLPALALLSLFPLSLARAQTPVVQFSYDFTGRGTPWVYGGLDSGSDPMLLQGFSMGDSAFGAAASGSVTFTMNGGSSPSVSLAMGVASAEGPGSKVDVSAGENLRYYWQVNVPSGPPGAVPISILFSSAYQLDITGEAYANSWGGQLDFWDNNGYRLAGPFAFRPGVQDTLSGIHSISVSVTPNVFYDTVINVGGDLVAPDGEGHWDHPIPNGISYRVYIDPTITLDPNWLTNHPGAFIQYYTLAPVAAIRGFQVSGGAAMLTCQGVPNLTYDVQRANDVRFTQNLTTLLTTNVPPAGLFLYTDPNPPGASAFYRLLQR